MPAGTRPPPDRTLNSWKEIAQFFAREVRTVERWEKEEGLPVHRHKHHRRSSVYAYPAELEAWWQERGSKLGNAASNAGSTARAWLRLAVPAVVLVMVAVVSVIYWIYLRSAANASAVADFPSVVLDGTRTQGRMGRAIVGDINGDGQKDLILSAGRAREVYVLFGGHLPARDAELPRDAAVIISGTEGRELSAAQAADFNGDGIADLLFAQVLDEPETFHATGPNYIVWGRPEWPAKLSLPEKADAVLRFDWVTDAAMRGCVAQGGASDLNGDGIDDVILGASEFGIQDRRASGAIFVLFGRKEWPRELEVRSSANVTLLGSRTGEGLGSHCAVGDFNGDGRADLGAHASEAKLWYLLGGRGRTYVFLGRTPWPRQIDAQATFALRVDGVHSRAPGVYTLLADVNGDGRDDLILGRPEVQEMASYPGELQIWFGGRHEGVVGANRADVVITGTNPKGALGAALAAGDVDADGFEDLFILEPGRGEVHLVYGRAEWQKKGPLRAYAGATLTRAANGGSAATAALADLDGDALPELVFASEEASKMPGTSAGRAWVIKPYFPVRLDVRPGDQPNVLILPQGVSAVRLYGYSREERNQIDPATVRLTGAAPSHYVTQDFDGDGMADLQAYFDNAKLKIAPETKRVAVTARTRSGLPLAGTDSVTVVLSAAPAVQSKTKNATPR